MLCHADGAAQWDPAAPEVRVGLDPGRGATPDPRIWGPAEYQGQLEAEIATYLCLLEKGEDFDPWNLSKRPSPTRSWMAKWCPMSMTPKFWGIKSAEAVHPFLGGGGGGQEQAGGQ